METSQRILGGLWGAVIGDALGVPVEFTSREERRRDPVTAMRGYGSHHQPPGTWSDDSSLLLCTVEALCEEEYHADQLADFFLAWEDRGYWTAHGTVFDIGTTTDTALSAIRRGVDPESAGGIGERDNGNGSLMRILPVALRCVDAPIEEMLFTAHRISALTHRHPRSRMACGLYCCIVKALLYGLTPAEAYRFMIEQGRRYYNAAPFHTEYPHFARLLSGALSDVAETDIASSGYVVHTLEAGIWCLLTSQSFEEAVLKAVNLGEDTDTTGCVTGGLAGVQCGLPSIPRSWIDMIAGKDAINELLIRFVSRQKG